MQSLSILEYKINTRLDLYLSEQTLTTTSRGCRIVYINIVIFRGNWLFHKRLVERDPVDFYVIFRLDQFVI